MNLIIVVALCALCGAERLDNRYLPPPPGGAGAGGAGGSRPGALQPPRTASSAAHLDGYNAPAQGFNRPNGYPQRFDRPTAPQRGFQESNAVSQGYHGANAPSEKFQGSNVPVQGSYVRSQGFLDENAPSKAYGGSNAPLQAFPVSNKGFQRFGESNVPIQGSNGAPRTQSFEQGLRPFEGRAQASPRGSLGASGPSREFNRGVDSPSSMFNSGNANAPEGLGGEAIAYRAAAVERPQAAQERAASSLRQEFQNDGDAFSYSFETSNGISAEAVGRAAGGVREQGAFSYSGDDGQQYGITYSADELGYRPRGDHIHPAILRLLEQIENVPFDDKEDGGAYRGPEEYNRGAGREYNTLGAPGQDEASASVAQYPQRPPASSRQQQGESRPSSGQLPSRPAFASPQRQSAAAGPAGFPQQQPERSRLASAAQQAAAPYSYTAAPGGGAGSRARPDDNFPAARPQPTFNSRDGYNY